MVRFLKESQLYPKPPGPLEQNKNKTTSPPDTKNQPTNKKQAYNK